MLDKIRDFKAKVCNPEAHLNNMASCDKEFKKMWKRDKEFIDYAGITTNEKVMDYVQSFIYLKTVYYDLELKPQSVELKCSRCKKVFEMDENLLEIFEEIKSEYLIIRNGKQVEYECGNIHPFQKSGI